MKLGESTIKLEDKMGAWLLKTDNASKNLCFLRMLCHCMHEYAAVFDTSYEPLSGRLYLTVSTIMDILFS